MKRISLLFVFLLVPATLYADPSDLSNAGKCNLEMAMVPPTLAAPDAEVATHPLQSEAGKNKIVKAYAALAKSKQSNPTLEELSEKLDISPEEFKGLIGQNGVFESMEQLKTEAQKKWPKNFQMFKDEDVYTPQREASLRTALLEKDVYIVTTAVAGAPVNRDFLDSLLKAAKEKNGAVFIRPANLVTFGLDPILLETPNVHIMNNDDDLELSPTLKMSGIAVTAKQKNPFMGLDRLGKRGQSQIVASPKSAMLAVPTFDNKYVSHNLYSTGAITDPVYDGKLFVQRRTDYIAENDHYMGALLLEKTIGKKNLMELGAAGDFNVRRLSYIPEEKGFTDLGKLYAANEETRTAKILALDSGDLHVGDLDQRTLTPLQQQLLIKLKPQIFVEHDWLNGDAIRHHDLGKTVTQAQKMKAGKFNLAEEIAKAIAFDNAIHATDPNIVIVKVAANHPAWIYRYLESGQYHNEPQNEHLGAHLADAMLNKKKDPLEYVMKELGDRDFPEIPRLEHPEKVIFLKYGDPFKVGPPDREVELGFHGDKGAGGSRGGFMTMARGADSSVSGHHHFTQWLNGTVVVGTLTPTELSYTKGGPSSWSQSVALIDEFGTVQVLFFKGGKWYSESEDKNIPPERFFKETYPKARSRLKSTNGVGQLDQYNRQDGAR